MQNNKQSLANSIMQQTKSFNEDLQNKREQAKRDEEKDARTFIGKKKHPKETSKETSKTVFNFIPLPFNTDDGERSVRVISDCFSILYDTDIPYDSGTGTKKEIYNIASIKEFKAYEAAFNTKVLSPEDEKLVKEVQQKLWAMREYFPYFDNAINLNKKNLSADFLDIHGGKLRINYFPYYMLIPSIELSEEIYSKNMGENMSKIKKYSLLHFNKSRLIEDWNAHIQKWQENAGSNFAQEFEEAFGGPDKDGNIKKYLSIVISDDEPKFDDKPQPAQPSDKQAQQNPANIPNRLTKFSIKKYIPDMFHSEEDGILDITPELLSKVVNCFDIPRFFRVATFERDVYQGLLAALNTAEGWLKEDGVIFGRQATTQAAEPSPSTPIEEDEVPF